MSDLDILEAVIKALTKQIVEAEVMRNQLQFVVDFERGKRAIMSVASRLQEFGIEIDLEQYKQMIEAEALPQEPKGE